MPNLYPWTIGTSADLLMRTISDEMRECGLSPAYRGEYFHYHLPGHPSLGTDPLLSYWLFIAEVREQKGNVLGVSLLAFQHDDEAISRGRSSFQFTFLLDGSVNLHAVNDTCNSDAPHRIADSWEEGVCLLVCALSTTLSDLLQASAKADRRALIRATQLKPPQQIEEVASGSEPTPDS